MRHVNLIVIVLKLHLKSKRVIEASTLFLQRVLEVANILTITVPPNALAIVALRHLLGVEQGFHALVVGALRFNQVYEVEFVGGEFTGVLNFEVEPLGIRCGIVVVL